MPEFTHLDAGGNPAMVDVGEKTATRRTAKARALVSLPEVVWEHLEQGDIRTPKGAVFQTAILAGVMAAKKTGDLIPLCHTLGLDDCQVQISKINSLELQILCRVTTTAKTGVEMEALTGASVAALTVYDMCKGFSHGIVVREIRLLEKSGGKKNYTYDDSKNAV